MEVDLEGIPEEVISARASIFRTLKGELLSRRFLLLKKLFSDAFSRTLATKVSLLKNNKRTWSYLLKFFSEDFLNIKITERFCGPIILPLIEKQKKPQKMIKTSLEFRN